ncbi:MAG: hypothetical protein PHI29_13480 [Gallionella sp.]|nr:hypothetical protein [Gallionella sp.]
MPADLQNKLIAVQMPKDSKCDCGWRAETQFVLAPTKKEAHRLAVEASKTRKLGGKFKDVCCGNCIAERIAERELFITESLKYSPIKLDRVTLDLKCLDCGAEIPFGHWAHFHADSGNAICIECGAKRGWTDKTIAVHNVKLHELKQDLSALRKRIKIESEGLFLLESKVKLNEIGESYQELERQLKNSVLTIESFVKALATPEEKKVLEQLAKELPVLNKLALEIKHELDVRLFWLDKRQGKNVSDMAAIDLEEEELERERNAEHAMAQVPT